MSLKQSTYKGYFSRMLEGDDELDYGERLDERIELVKKGDPHYSVFVKKLATDAGIDPNDLRMELAQIPKSYIYKIAHNKSARSLLLTNKNFMYFVGYSSKLPNCIKVLDMEKDATTIFVYDINNPRQWESVIASEESMDSKLKYVNNFYALIRSRSARKLIRKLINGKTEL